MPEIQTKQITRNEMQIQNSHRIEHKWRQIASAPKLLYWWLCASVWMPPCSIARQGTSFFGNAVSDNCKNHSLRRGSIAQSETD